MCPEVTRELLKLMEQPQVSDGDAAMDALERYVVLLHDRTSSRHHVDELRFDLFTQKGKDVSNIPLAKGVLLQHTRRAIYQAGHIWSRVLEP